MTGSIGRRKAGIILGLVLTFLWISIGEVSAFQHHKKMKIRHIGVIVYAKPFLQSYEGLRKGLQEKGYKLDTELIFAVHSVDRDLNLIDPLLNKFATAGFDLIYTATTPVTLAVRTWRLQHQIDIPVVFTVVADPVGSGIVTSLRHPDDNITGISHVSKELLPQCLLQFKKAFPEIRRLAVFFDPDEEISQSSFNQQDLNLAARDQGLTMVAEHVLSFKKMQSVCRSLKATDIDSIFMLPDPLSVACFPDLVKLSRRLRIPLMVIDNQLLRQGGVISYSPDFYEVGRQSATLVDQIFKGVVPGDIAIQNPEKVKLVFSLKEVRRLKLKFNEEILLQADEVLR